MSKKTEIKLDYFGEREELAVLEYIYGEEANRNKIFNEVLNPAFNIMVESLIKRYGLMREDMSIEDLKNDTISFLLTKFTKFRPEENKKAYSYYGTICVNYLKSQLLKHSKQKNRSVSYEDISSDLEEDERYTYEMETDNKLPTFDFIPMIVLKIKEEINVNKKLKTNELKVGWAIIEILENWQVMITNNDKSNILARNKILYQLRETTLLSSKEVRNSLKKYKVIYEILKHDIYG